MLLLVLNLLENGYHPFLQINLNVPVEDKRKHGRMLGHLMYSIFSSCFQFNVDYFVQFLMNLHLRGNIPFVYNTIIYFLVCGHLNLADIVCVCVFFSTFYVSEPVTMLEVDI